MKRVIVLVIFFLLFAVGVIEIGAKYRPREKIQINCELKEKLTLRPVSLPNEISRVDRIKYSENFQQLFLVAETKDSRRSLWSMDKDGVFTLQVVNDKPLFNGFIHIGGRGDVYFESDNPHFLYKRNNGTSKFNQIPVHKEIFWSIAESDNGELYGSAWSYNSPYIFRSADNGQSWQIWKDFSKIFPEEAVPYDSNDDRNKIRHLHDIVYVKGNLIVGTGDITRWTVLSKDGGITWDKIWNEGLVSHLMIPERDILLMGSDKDGGWGIAAYDFTTGKTRRVWNPLDCGWSGYIYSIIASGGSYYAAAHNENYSPGRYGILKSENAIDWKPVAEFIPSRDGADTSLYIDSGPDNTIYVSMNGKLFYFEE